jgi:hypothetical protein
MLIEFGERLAVLEGEWRALDLACRGGERIADEVGDEFCGRLHEVTAAILAATASSPVELAVQARAMGLLCEGQAGESSPERAFVDAVLRYVGCGGC